MCQTAWQTVDIMDVAKTLALDCDKGDNTIIYFQVYTGEKRHISPQSLMKCIELIFELLLQCSRKSIYEARAQYQ